MKPAMEPEKASITRLDIRIAISALLCCLTSAILNHFNVKFTVGEMHLEIIQKMTACISCLLLCQENTKFSAKAGVNRLIITAIGGIVGIAAILIDTAVGSEWLMVPLMGIGVLLTLFFCKLAKMPYIQARIGCVTFVLVTCTLNGNARVYYAVFRLVSTLYAAVIVLLVTWLWEKLVPEKR